MMGRGRVEVAILDEDNKNLYFMQGKIKREYPKGDTFAWPIKLAAEKRGCSECASVTRMSTIEVFLETL